MVTKRLFGQTPDGKSVFAYTITNRSGTAVTVLDYGAALQSVVLPYKGKRLDVVLGYDTLDNYMQNDAYLGASVGRYAGRIPDSLLRIGAEAFPLTANEGPNHLHGGRCGFSHRIWFAKHTRNTVCFDLLSPDGDEGYPGMVRFYAIYTLKRSKLTITYRAESDRITAWNPTNHAYWNLNGHDAGDARTHRLEIPADRYVPVGPDMIPVDGEADVSGTRFDFRSLREIGGAYDHSFVLHKGPIRLYGSSGVGMEIMTDCAAVQLYTAEFLSERKGKQNALYRPFGAICLETQGRQAQRGRPIAEENVLSRPGSRKTRKTTYRFITKEDGKWNPSTI